MIKAGRNRPPTLVLKSALLLILLGQTLMGSIPSELQQVLDSFWQLKRTSLQIHQRIDWRFSKPDENFSLQLDIQDNEHFRVDLTSFGLEIFVSPNAMMTINHQRRQILIEDATPDALLRQIFVGGDLNLARFKGLKQLPEDARRMDFSFDSDFSDWDKMSLFLNTSSHLTGIFLKDYDGNDYHLDLEYLPDYLDYSEPDVKQEYLTYQLADLRSN